MPDYKNLLDQHPFISWVRCNDQEYIGIIININSSVVSLYDYAMLPSKEIKKRFLQLGETWWWQSNRLYPINIFLKKEFAAFRPFIRTLIAKDTVVMHGPETSMNALIKRRTKRKNIQIIRKNQN